MDEVQKQFYDVLVRIADALEKNSGLVVTQSIEGPKKAKYTWYEVSNPPEGGNDRTRKCNNSPCEFYVVWFDGERKYKHGTYDHDTKQWVHHHDTCKHFKGGS
jgi:hypothetical protein